MRSARSAHTTEHATRGTRELAQTGAPAGFFVDYLSAVASALFDHKLVEILEIAGVYAFIKFKE